MNIFSASYRVYYEDTDAGGVVYYANYLKFAERARTDYLRAKGISQSTLAAEQGVLFVVHSLEAKFHAAAKLDDMLDVSVTVAETGNTYAVMHQEITAGGKKLFSLSVRIVSVNREIRPVKLPFEL